MMSLASSLFPRNKIMSVSAPALPLLALRTGFSLFIHTSITSEHSASLLQHHNFWVGPRSLLVQTEFCLPALSLISLLPSWVLRLDTRYDLATFTTYVINIRDLRVFRH